MAAIHMGNNFLHPEAIKGYLECRKLLVERETQLVAWMCNPIPNPDQEDFKRIDSAIAFKLIGYLERTSAHIDRELENVRREITGIDILLSGKELA